MVKLNCISKHYIEGKKVVAALNNITLSFDVGEIVVVTGASGSGKSTLLNILSGTDYATSGEYLIDGVDTDSFDEADWSDFRCRNIGIVYQDYRLIEEYTVKENIEAALSLFSLSKKERKNKVLKLMNETGISTIANKKVKYLSGGQRQRVAIARAVAKDCKILLADEPTANLDEDNAVEITLLLKKVAKGRLLVVVTHNEEQFKDIETRKIVLSDGKVATNKVVKQKEIGDCNARENKLTLSQEAFAFGVLKYFKPPVSIFLISLIILFVSLVSYSVSLDMVNGYNEGLTNTEFFQNLSPDRYIISKFDYPKS